MCGKQGKVIPLCFVVDAIQILMDIELKLWIIYAKYINACSISLILRALEGFPIGTTFNSKRWTSLIPTLPTRQARAQSSMDTTMGWTNSRPRPFRRFNFGSLIIVLICPFCLNSAYIPPWFFWNICVRIPSIPTKQSLILNTISTGDNLWVLNP